MQSNNALRSIKRFFKVFYRTTLLHKLFYFLAFLVCFILITNYGQGQGQDQIEGFTHKTPEFKTNDAIPAIYDDFYVSIYDDLVFSPGKNEYEITKLIEYTKLPKNSNVLDIGSGTGHHVSSLLENGYKAQGIDISPSMIKKAKQNYPNSKFEEVDALDSMSFTAQSFNQITCLYFTVYYMQNKQKFFENCMKWLISGGFLALHLVNRDKFDPIIPAGNPFNIVSPQKYAKKRIMNTIVKFDNFEYKSKFDLKDAVDGKSEPNALMLETFKNLKDGNIRKNEHKLYMPTQAEILDLAKSVGFIIHSKIDMLSCQYENQYIYILQKPT